MFQYFLSIAKVYLGLHGGAVQVELDVHDLSYKLDIENGDFKEVPRNVVAPREAIDFFDRSFEGPLEIACRRSPNFDYFLKLDALIEKEERNRKKKRVMAHLQ